jgi:hypothetical protein
VDATQIQEAPSLLARWNFYNASSSNEDNTQPSHAAPMETLEVWGDPYA